MGGGGGNGGAQRRTDGRIGCGNGFGSNDLRFITASALAQEGQRSHEDASQERNLLPGKMKRPSRTSAQQKKDTDYCRYPWRNGLGRIRDRNAACLTCKISFVSITNAPEVMSSMARRRRRKPGPPVRSPADMQYGRLIRIAERSRAPRICRAH